MYSKKIKKTANSVAADISDAVATGANAVAGAVGTISGTATDIMSGIMVKAADGAKWFGKEARDIGEQLLALGLDPAVIPIILSYYGTLKLQASGKWQKLPEHIKICLQPYFGINLDKIEYAVNIHTGHGNAITFDTQIFFPGSIRLETESDLRWLIHEMTHSQQYSDEGGLILFLHKYVKDIITKIITEQRLNIHDFLPLEKAADKLSDEVTPLIMGKIKLPIFDPGYYLKIHTDVAKVYGNNNLSGAMIHWMEYGISEGRRSSEHFDVRAYLAHYQDLQNVIGNDFFKAIDHYLIYGMKEGRITE